MTDKRHTTVHDRFEISCTYCGRLAGDKSLSDAIKTAQHYNTQHAGANEEVWIYDIMAHIGAVQVWDYTGRVASRRNQ